MGELILTVVLTILVVYLLLAAVIIWRSTRSDGRDKG